MERFEKIAFSQLYPNATPTGKNLYLLELKWPTSLINSKSIALNLLEKLLAFDPMSRIEVKEALEHPYFELFHDPDDEVWQTFLLYIEQTI